MYITCPSQKLHPAIEPADRTDAESGDGRENGQEEAWNSTTHCEDVVVAVAFAGPQIRAFDGLSIGRQLPSEVQVRNSQWLTTT